MTAQLLDRLLAATKSASPLGSLADASTDLGLCIVAPSHPWLGGWLDDALGLTPGDAVLVTLPGGPWRAEAGGLDPDVIRAVAAACYLHGCEEVLILALPGAMVPADSAALVEAFRSRGVDRGALPSSDLRGYFGLLDDPTHWLPRAAAALREAAALPSDLQVHAGIIDPRVGKLKIVESGYEKEPGAARSARRSDPMGLGGGGPVPLASASLLPIQQRPELDAAHQRATTPTQHVVDLQTLNQIKLGVSLPPPGELLPVGTLVEALSASAGAGPVVRAEHLAPRPPPLPRRPAPRPPPPPSRSRAQPRPEESVDLDASAIEVRGQRLDPDIATALRAVRAFYQANFDTATRRQMLSSANEAMSSGLGVEVGLRVVIQPVIRLGPVRYQVLNELLAVKGALAKMPVEVASLLLRALLS